MLDCSQHADPGNPVNYGNGVLGLYLGPSWPGSTGWEDRSGGIFISNYMSMTRTLSSQQIWIMLFVVLSLLKS